MRRLAVRMVCLALAVTTPATTSDLEFGEVYAKVVSGPDEDGDLEISIRVTVINNSDSEQDVDLSIQGLDSDEFEVYETDLEGKVGPKSQQSITDTDFIDAEVYQTITHWRIEE